MKGLYWSMLFLLLGQFCLGKDNTVPGRDSLFCGELPIDRLEKGYRFNPAAFGWLEQKKKSRLSFRFRTDDAKTFYSQFDGDKGNLYRAEALGYGVEKGKFMYSGIAAWESGLRRNTRYTDMRDERLLGPYLVADSLGGNYYHELYRLGGSAALYGKNIVYGLRADYRGTVAYRKADPRPKNTISELQLNPGIVIGMKKWDLGLFLDYIFYKQHLTIRIEESSRKDYFYLLRGFGLYDYSFSGIESSFRRYYRSHSYGGGVQLRQQKKYGGSFMLRYDRRKMEVEEGDLRTPFLLKEGTVAAGVNWRFRLKETAVLLLEAEGEYMSQTGLEKSYEKTVTDTATGVYVWRVLSESDKYERETVSGNISMVFQHTPSGKTAYWYGLQVIGKDDRERYLYPDYSQRITGIKGVVSGGMIHRFKRRKLYLDLAGGMYRTLKSDLNAPPAEETASDFWVREYEFRKRNFYELEVDLAYHWPLKGQTSMAVEAGGKYARSAGGIYRWGIETGLALFF